MRSCRADHGAPTRPRSGRHPIGHKRSAPWRSHAGGPIARTSISGAGATTRARTGGATAITAGGATTIGIAAITAGGAGRAPGAGASIVQQRAVIDGWGAASWRGQHRHAARSRTGPTLAIAHPRWPSSTATSVAVASTRWGTRPRRMRTTMRHAPAAVNLPPPVLPSSTVRAVILCLPALLGCNQVFGLDPPRLGDAGAAIDARPACGDPGGAPDEDGDGFRDECDNCPHVKQSGDSERKDDDGDLIGAACDPHKSAPDRVVAFHTFAQPVAAATIVPLADAGGGSWTYRDGALLAEGTLARTDMLARLDVGLAGVTIDVDVSLPTALPLLPIGASQSVGVWADVAPPGGAQYDPTFPPGALLELFQVSPGTGVEARAHLTDTTIAGTNDTTGIQPELFEGGARYRLVLTCEGDGACAGEVWRDGASLATLSLTIAARPGAVGLRTYGIDARFDHLMVYAPM